MPCWPRIVMPTIFLSVFSEIALASAWMSSKLFGSDSPYCWKRSFRYITKVLSP